MARNHDPHDRLMALRNQVIRDKASQSMLLMEIRELKSRGAADLIRSLQGEMDIVGKRVKEFESQIKALEIRLFMK